MLKIAQGGNPERFCIKNRQCFQLLADAEWGLQISA